MDCGVLCVANRAEEAGEATYTYVRLKCKAWRCPHCGPEKAVRLRKAISMHATEHKLTRFLTLTLDPRSIPEDVDQVKYIRGVWSKFRV